MSVYLIFLLVLIIGVKSQAKRKVIEQPVSKNIFLSVVIPVRNEPEVRLLINDLLNQSISGDGYEIIVVNDHSDNVPVVPKTVTILSLPKSMSGKKAALTEGINFSKGEVIVTIDGDCRVGNYFLKKIKELFESSNTVLSPGLVSYYKPRNLFQKMQTMELNAIMSTGLSLNSYGFTSLSNGANLAFLKEVWQEAGGYKQHQHIPSGDDEFFVQHIAGKYPDRIQFRKDAESVVFTKSHEKFLPFFNQRIRWAGKWKAYHDKRMSVIAAFVFLFHISICGGLILLFSTENPMLILLFSLKFILEAILILQMVKVMKNNFYPAAFIILQFLYSPYVVLFGITANFVTYSWKGREFRY